MMDTGYKNPLLSRKIRSFAAAPRLFQLDVLLNDEADHLLTDYHKLIFYWADDYQRIRIVIEILAAQKIKKAVAQNHDVQTIRNMLDICLKKCALPSPVARLHLLTVARIEKQIDNIELVDEIHHCQASRQEWQRLVHIFSKSRFPGDSVCPAVILQLFKDKAGMQKSITEPLGPIHNFYDLSPLQRFQYLLTNRANNTPEDLDALVHHFRRLRTDYQKFRAGEEIAIRAIKNKDFQTLEYLQENALRYMVKRHRKAGLLAAVGIGFYILGFKQRALRLLQLCLACFLENNQGFPAEQLCRTVCQQAKSSCKTTECLILLRRLLFPRSPGIQDREMALGFSKVVGEYWDKIGPHGRKRMMFYLAYLQINRNLLPPSIGNIAKKQSTATLHSGYSPRNESHDICLDSVLSHWLYGLSLSTKGHSSDAEAHFQKGWEMCRREKNPDRVYRSVHTFLRCASNLNKNTLYDSNLEKFKQIRGILNFSEQQAMRSLNRKYQKAILDSAAFLISRLETEPVNADSNRMDVSVLSDFAESVTGNISETFSFLWSK